MPSDTDTHPADRAIADAEAAREEFFAQASDIYDAQARARTTPLNPMADKLTGQRGSDSATNGNLSPGSVPAPPTDPPSAPSRSPSGGKRTAGLADPPSIPPAPNAPDAPPPRPTPASSGAIPGPSALAGSGSASPAPSAPGKGGETPPTGHSTPASSSPDFSDLPGPDAFAKKEVKPDHWKRLHTKADHFAERATQAEREVNELRQRLAGGGQPPPEFQQQLTALQQERDNLLSRLEAVAVERSPRFEAAFKPRQEAAIATAKAAVGPDKADRAAQLLAMPESAWRDEQIEALVSDLGAHTIRGQRLLNAVADLDRIAAERAHLSAQSGQLFKQWQAEESDARQRQQADRQRQVEQTFASVAADWKKASGDLLDDDGLALAKDVFMGQRDLADIATAAMWVAVGPKAAANALRLQTRVAELESEVARLRGASPQAARDAGGSANAASDDDIPADTGYADAVAQAAMKAGLLRR